MPAAAPEFKGNVAAVLTEKYWDHELVLLRAKDAEIRQQVKKLQAEPVLDVVQYETWLRAQLGMPASHTGAPPVVMLSFTPQANEPSEASGVP